MRWVAILLVVVGCDADPAPSAMAVEVIVRDRQPATIDLLTLTKGTVFNVQGANICAHPRVTLAGRDVRDMGGGDSSTYAFALGEDAIEAVAKRLADADCGDEIPLEFTLDCSHEPPPAGTAWAVASAALTWPARVGPMARTTVRAATTPTSRAAGILFEVDGDVAPEMFEAAVPENVGVVRRMSLHRDENGTSRLSLHPQPPLPPGGTLTLRLDAGIHGLHARTGCLDFVGVRDITIHARDEADPTMELTVRHDGGVFVIDGDEMGSRSYRLLERHPSRDGVLDPNPAPISSTNAAPHFEVRYPDPTIRHCFSIEVAGVPTLFRSVERCVDPP